MVIPNNTPDIEPVLPEEEDENLLPTGRKRPRWFRRAAAYALRRAADATQGGRRRRTAVGQGRALARERRRRLLGGVSA